MSQKTKFDVDLVKLTSIVVDNASITNNSQLSEVDLSKDILAYRFGFHISVSEDLKNVKIVFSCDVKATNKVTKEDTKISGHFDIAYIFSVGNLKSLIEGLPAKKMDSELVISLANIAYSTSRGVLFTRCQGTTLKQLILPIMSTSELINLFESKQEFK